MRNSLIHLSLRNLGGCVLMFGNSLLNLQHFLPCISFSN